MNKEWHARNKMPPKATLKEKIDWHLRHQKNCSCREIPKSLTKFIKSRKRGGD